MNWHTEIEAAAQRISGHVVETPVMTSDSLFDRPIALKLEHLQHTGSFKARGAFNTLLAADVPKAGIVAASGGNHGAAAAYAAHELGVPARIYVPEMAGPAKIALIQRTGADLQVVAGEYADALAQAQAYETANGAMQIHAYDAPLTVAGQGTLTREWQNQQPDLDTVLIAVGGGGLIAGALAYAGKAKVVAVEPDTCNALGQARAAAAPVDVPVSGVAANALGARRIGQICFDLAQANDTPVVTVTNDAITQAQLALWQAHRLLVEPAGACALAALMSGAYVPSATERVGVLLCGGNIAPDPLA